MRKLIITRGFTITELIAVIAIISVLSGLLLVGVVKILKSADIKKTRATIEQLETALEMYAQNWGTYPNDDGITSGGFTSCSNLINALESETTEARRRGGPYVRYANNIKVAAGYIAANSLYDPWEQPYRYHWNTNPPRVTAIGQSNSSTNITFNIWSIGPNGTNESESSIINSSYPEPSPEAQRRWDDIVNW